MHRVPLALLAILAFSAAAVDTPVSFWSSAPPPAAIALDDRSPVELGLRFQVTEPGRIRAIRFYRDVAIGSGYVVSLWRADGTLLGRADVIEGQGPTPGWQRVDLFPPVAVLPGESYVASYFASRGGYSYSWGGLAAGAVAGPLVAPADGDGGGNGLFRYGEGGGFPAESFRASNYWVDVEFVADPVAPITAPRDLTARPVNASEIDLAWQGSVEGGGETARSVEHLLYRDGALLATLPRGMSGWRDTLLAAATGHSYVVRGRSSSGLLGPPSATVVATTPPAPATPAVSLWGPDEGPSLEVLIDGPVEVGIRFHADVDGSLAALRYYKADINQAPHRGHLWSADGTLLATTIEAIPSGEFGFRELAFPDPPAIAAGTSYVISYSVEAGAYGWTSGYFSPLYASGVDNPPLHADREDSLRGPAGAFPSLIDPANPWVDLVFTPAAGDGPTHRWFGDDTVPDRPTVDDHAAVELGVRFRTSEDGEVRAIRFYRGAPSAAGYTVTLWDDEGRALASVALPADDATPGWRSATLSPPVPVSPGRVYTASYHAPDGGYAFAAEAFADGPLVSGPLIAPASDQVGGNGVFRYGAPVAFPDESYRASSYWVDVDLAVPEAPADGG